MALKCPETLKRTRNDARVKAVSRSLLSIVMRVLPFGVLGERSGVPLDIPFRGGRGGEEETRAKEKTWMRRRK
jgi:hypothetical protein